MVTSPYDTRPPLMVALPLPHAPTIPPRANPSYPHANLARTAAYPSKGLSLDNRIIRLVALGR
jgi:hypothetical protein